MISRPTMICALKENTKGLAHMKRNKCGKSLKKKG